MASSCAVDGVAMPLAFATAKEFLTDLPKCAYTTALVRRQLHVADWDVHLERLRRSVLALDAATQAYGAFLAYLKGDGSTLTCALLDRLIRPTLCTCLNTLCSLEDSEEAMLVLALPAEPPPWNVRPSQPPGAVTGTADRQASPPSPHLHVCAFAAPYRRPPPAQHGGVSVLLALSPPRNIPEAKDTSWVAGRARFEVQRREGEAEVVLCTAVGEVLEGLVTNMFVVAEVAGGGVEVQTAPCGGVVWGTLRRRVLDTCRGLGVAVREVHPQLEERERWREAFLTNSVRLVQPIWRATWRGGAASAAWGGKGEWEVVFDPVPGPLTSQLRRLVEGGLTWHCMQAIPPGGPC